MTAKKRVGIRRFYWVAPKRRDAMRHMAKRALDGDRTYCGRIIAAGAWRVVTQSKLPRCTDCQSAPRE